MKPSYRSQSMIPSLLLACIASLWLSACGGSKNPAAPPATTPKPPVFALKWGSNGSGDGQFSGADGVAVDGSGNVYVTETYSHRVQKFTPAP